MQGNVLRKIHVTENPTPFYLEFTVQRAMSISESKEIKKKKYFQSTLLFLQTMIPVHIR